jgi:uncharacterized membrane protein YciS (DUF1049 family)
MKFLYKLLTLAIVLATLGIAVLFALQNKEPVALDMLIYSFAPRSLALWVLSAFALGGICGMLVSSAIMLRQRATMAGNKRQLGKAQAELDRLRTAGLTSSE